MSVKPKKSLGQHWLYDVRMLEEIIETAGLIRGEDVLEVGPGTGALTQIMLERGANVTAIELDVDLFQALSKPNAFGQDYTHQFQIVHGDILGFDLTKMPQGYKVVANIPYYLTSNLIRVLSESSNPPKSATLLIQREVAERLCASPGDMSILSVTAQMYFRCGLGPLVPAKLFTPPPKVDSQVVVLTRREVPAFGDREAGELFRIVKAGFANKRKTLLNSLSGGLNVSKEETKEWLLASKIDPHARAQQLSLEDWLRLFDNKK